MLKTIEAFAVECSINKVWTSEALAYVVDEAVQVFGGNGYSREFPVERAYRDARITRIYEGTNEINRLIIPTRLFKQGADLFTPAREDRGDGDPARRSARRRARAAGPRQAAGRAALGQAAATYGDAVREEQEVLGHAADIVIEVYAIESAIARAEKLVRRDQERGQVALDVTRVYTSDAADRMAHAGKQVAAALAARTATSPELTDAVGDVAGNARLRHDRRAAPHRRRRDSGRAVSFLITKLRVALFGTRVPAPETAANGQLSVSVDDELRCFELRPQNNPRMPTAVNPSAALFSSRPVCGRVDCSVVRRLYVSTSGEFVGRGRVRRSGAGIHRVMYVNVSEAQIGHWSALCNSSQSWQSRAVRSCIVQCMRRLRPAQPGRARQP